jgi:hypothetical protein
MGLLDDAIREHLELKRRRGADPGELAREEHEALGPARRGPMPPASDEDELDDLVDEAGAEAGSEHAEPTEHELGEHTAEYHIDEPDEANEPEAHADGEDVLEETPDFLQETPEHDRLWFEQRPPRDFDFDD